MKYRPEIDGLRALAVLPVIAFHAGFGFMPGGFLGVDVFFVISGFLITGLIAGDLRSGTFSLLNFYERRIRRILPALFLVMFCCIPFAWVLMGPAQSRDFSQSLIAVPLFLSNILFWRESGYFDGAAEEKPLLHTWSLGVEEQFYLLFPLLLLLLWRFGKRPVFYALCLLFFISLIASEYASRQAPTANFYLAPFRFWEILSGGLCALYVHKEPLKPSSPLSLIGLALIICSFFIFNENSRLPSALAAIPVLGTCLILLFSSGSKAAKILSFPPLIGIGLISYSAYLWHQPIFAFARIGLPSAPGPALLTMLAVLSIGLAYLSWRFVEQPFRRKDAPIFPARRQIFGATCLASLCFVVIGALGHFTQGAKFRYKLSQLQTQYLETAAYSPKRIACHAGKSKPISPETACRFGAENTSIAVYGDSHGVELAYALSLQAEPYGAGVQQLTHTVCVRNANSSQPKHPCQIWAKDTIDYLSNSSEITHIVMSFRLNAALFGPHEGIYPKLPQQRSKARRQEILQTLVSDIKALTDSGKTVIYVLQAPELPHPMEELVLKRAASKDIIYGADKVWWDARSDYARNYLTQNLPENVVLIDPADLFCAKQKCRAGENGISYYFDDDHMSIGGAGIIAQSILPHITAQ